MNTSNNLVPGNHIASVTPLSERQFRLWKLLFGPKPRAKLYKRLASHTRRGESLESILTKIYNNNTDNGRRGTRDIIPIVVADLYHYVIERSENINQVLAKWAPPHEALVLGALSDSALDPDVLDVIRDMTTKKDEADTAIKHAVRPIRLSIAFLIGSLYLAAVYFTPLLQKQTKLVQPGESARLFISIAEFAQTWGIPLFIVALTINFMFPYILRNFTGPYRLYFEKLPFFSGFRLWSGLTFLMSITPLLAANQTKDEALARLLPHAEPYMHERISAVMQSEGSLPESLRDCGYDWPSRQIINDLLDSMSEDNRVQALTDLTQEETRELTDYYTRVAKQAELFTPIMLGLFLAFFTVVVSDFKIIGLK